MPFDLANTPPTETILLISKYLDKIIATNDTISSPQLTRFHARAIPSIDIQGYLNRILKYAPCGNECFFAAMVYFERMANPYSSVNSGNLTPSVAQDRSRNRRELLTVNSYNVHRLLITGIMVAVKFLSDIFFTNVHVSRVGGLPVVELNQLEVEFLLLNDFNLSVSLEELQDCADRIQDTVAGVSRPLSPLDRRRTPELLTPSPPVAQRFPLNSSPLTPPTPQSSIQPVYNTQNAQTFETDSKVDHYAVHDDKYSQDRQLSSYASHSLLTPQSFPLSSPSPRAYHCNCASCASSGFGTAVRFPNTFKVNHFETTVGNEKSILAWVKSDTYWSNAEHLKMDVQHSNPQIPIVSQSPLGRTASCVYVNRSFRALSPIPRNYSQPGDEFDLFGKGVPSKKHKPYILPPIKLILEKDHSPAVNVLPESTYNFGGETTPSMLMTHTNLAPNIELPHPNFNFPYPSFTPSPTNDLPSHIVPSYPAFSNMFSESCSCEACLKPTHPWMFHGERYEYSSETQAANTFYDTYQGEYDWSYLNDAIEYINDYIPREPKLRKRSRSVEDTSTNKRVHQG